MPKVQIEERRDEATVMCRVKWTADAGEILIFHVFVAATLDEIDDEENPSDEIKRRAIAEAKRIARHFAGAAT